MSYLATIETAGLPIQAISRVLFAGLIDCINAAPVRPLSSTGAKFKAVIGELDLESPDRRTGFARANYFGRLAHKVGYEAYLIEELNYYHPLIDLEEIRAAQGPENSYPTGGRELLLYVPSTPLPPGHRHIPREEMDAILAFIILEVYPDSLDTDQDAWTEYLTYAQGVYKGHAAELNEDVRVRVLDLRSEHVRAHGVSSTSAKLSP